MAERRTTPRGSYTTYTPEQKAQIGRYAAEHGNAKAVKKYTSELGVSVKESTVRQFKKAYYLQLNQGKDPDEIKAIPIKRRGRPSKTGLPSSASSSPAVPVKVDEVATEFPDEVDISTCIAVCWIYRGTLGVWLCAAELVIIVNRRQGTIGNCLLYLYDQWLISCG